MLRTTTLSCSSPSSDDLNHRAEIDATAKIVARYISLGHPIRPLISTLAYATVREDVDFHYLQVLEAGGSASLEQDRDTLTRADLGLPVVVLTRGWEPPTGELADFLDDAHHSLPANTDIVLLPLAADDQTALVDGALLAQWQRFVDRQGDSHLLLCAPREQDQP